jgi:hypothetical protein
VIKTAAINAGLNCEIEKPGTHPRFTLYLGRGSRSVLDLLAGRDLLDNLLSILGAPPDTRPNLSKLTMQTSCNKLLPIARP